MLCRCFGLCCVLFLPYLTTYYMLCRTQRGVRNHLPPTTRGGGVARGWGDQGPVFWQVNFGVQKPTASWPAPGRDPGSFPGNTLTISCRDNFQRGAFCCRSFRSVSWHADPLLHTLGTTQDTWHAALDCAGGLVVASRHRRSGRWSCSRPRRSAAWRRSGGARRRIVGGPCSTRCRSASP